MKPKSSSPCSNKLTNVTYPELNKFNPPPAYFSKAHFNIIYRVVYSLLAFQPKFCIHFLSHKYMPLYVIQTLFDEDIYHEVH